MTPSPARLRASVFYFFFATGLCFASWASRIPDLKRALGLSDAALGTLLLAAPIGQLVFVPVAGQFVTHFGSRRVLLVATTAYALLLFFLGRAAAAWQLAVMLFLLGVISNLVFLATNTQAVGVERIYGRPIMASFHGGWSIAGFSGAALGMLMRALDIGPAPHFLFVGVLVTIGTWFNAQALIAHAAPRAEDRVPLFSKPDPALLRLGAIGFCVLAAEGTMFDWSGVYFQQVVRPSGNLVLLGYAAFMLCMALGRFAGDGFTHRYGSRRVLLASGLLIFTGLGLAALLPSIACATLGLMITGFGVSTVIPVLYSTAGRSGIGSPSMAIATVSGLAFFGFLAAPPLIGYIAEATSMRLSFFVIALLGLSVSLLTAGASLLRDAEPKEA
ncbi:MFS transporter [Solimonas sp. K1W22B-7]|uniref:MFS transporter n=1 Tax=Solimonas sp. K1W22B-7 TaxID=2303331 RepID=UPI000E32D6A4|nr:MFS transporter [Solimonas sp. K1W22B-7]AXQ27610.1 MFS transporter [Solimonas sp. K1W22B-7]